MNAQQRETTVERLLSLLRDKDWDGVAQHYHDDVVVEWPQTNERMTSKDACLEVYRNYPGGFPELAPRRIRAEGDMAVAEGDARYPDGSVWRTVEIFEFRGDKVAKETAYFAQAAEAPEWRSRWVDKDERILERA